MTDAAAPCTRATIVTIEGVTLHGWQAELVKKLQDKDGKIAGWDSFSFRVHVKGDSVGLQDFTLND